MKAFFFCVLAMATCMPARGGVDYSGGTYRENFDSLGTNGVSWTNGAAVPGCYAYEGLLSSWRWVSDYGVCGGAFSAVEQGDSLLNCGNKGSTNRALGAVAYQLDVTFAL